ncbi:GGDEF domain-containing protein [Desulfovibrio inopinatus]|uniref:GGDEF domain-containing protein n=1 Tax=Desulfovibrio inopinatus TaxID=102109 RepID=UPI000411FB86|nr:GGDEF domain-containing protein [Desulfovibrio inopinatus]
MKRQDNPDLIWGIGLYDDHTQEITTALGKGYVVKNWPVNGLPKLADIESSDPLVVFIPMAVWGALPKGILEALRDWDLPQRVLILDDGEFDMHIEEILENGFLTALRIPLSPKKIRDAIFRAKEVKNLYDDIYRMTREIMLERELLARKTDQVMFLNQILTRASETLDPSKILLQATEDFNILFPINGLQAAFWQNPSGESLEAEIFLSNNLQTPHEDDWIEFLLSGAGQFSSYPVNNYKVTILGSKGCSKRTSLPIERAKTILLPLKTANTVIGCLAISRVDVVPLGKDQVQSLHAAVNHLALALRNALLYREVLTQADHDGLTRVHNRHYFDKKLQKEIERHTKRNAPLSLLMIDLDHFKQINDAHGHQAGDDVLRDIARVMRESTRVTDHIARYGGEEFVILLPKTDEDRAKILAERIRKRIANHTFTIKGEGNTITASIGVATYHPKDEYTVSAFLDDVDKALYQAKTQGRDKVCLACDLEVELPKAFNA